MVIHPVNTTLKRHTTGSIIMTFIVLCCACTSLNRSQGSYIMHEPDFDLTKTHSI